MLQMHDKNCSATIVWMMQLSHLHANPAITLYPSSTRAVHGFLREEHGKPHSALRLMQVHNYLGAVLVYLCYPRGRPGGSGAADAHHGQRQAALRGQPSGTGSAAGEDVMAAALTRYDITGRSMHCTRVKDENKGGQAYLVFLMCKLSCRCHRVDATDCAKQK